MKDNKKELGYILNEIIDTETEKPDDQMDCDLIAQCTELLNKLNGSEQIEESVIAEQISKIQADNRRIVAGQKRKRLLKSSLKFAAAVFAVLFLLAAPITVMAAVQNRSPLDILDDLGLTVRMLPYNEPVEINGITFERVSPDNIAHYDDIESLIKAETIDILYPSWLPDGVRITDVKKSIVSDGAWITYRFSDNGIGMAVVENDSTTELDLYDAEMLEILYYHDSDYYHAQFDYNGFTYNLFAETQEILEEIILHLRDV